MSTHLRDALARALASDGPVTLRNLRVLDADAASDGAMLSDVHLAEGRIQAIVPAGERHRGLEVDCAGCMVGPVFADLHVHLDKTHTADRIGAVDATLLAAVQATLADKARWTREDVEARAERALNRAYLHGTASMRTHVDRFGPNTDMAWDVLAELRERWKDRIALQLVAMLPLEHYLRDDAEATVRRIASARGLLGGVTRIPGRPQAEAQALLPRALDAMFRLAQRHGLDVDLHVDESSDTGQATLAQVAEAAARHDMHGRVVCGHCCSLALQPPDEQARVLQACADARLTIVSLPLVNAHLQDRAPGRTPRWRGLAPLQEADAIGIAVALASDNCDDAFHPYGDYDPLEVLREGVRHAHLAPGADAGIAWVTTLPAHAMGLRHRHRLAAGATADLIVYRTTTPRALLARPQADRIVVRNGTLLPPDCESNSPP